MKGNLMILVCFLAGVFVGLGDFAPEWLLGHDLPIIILSLLIVQVGISLGSNNDLRGLFHSLNPRMSLCLFYYRWYAFIFGHRCFFAAWA